MIASRVHRERPRVEIDVLRPRDMSPDMIARWRELQRLDPAWDSPFLSPLWPLAVERAQGGARAKVRTPRRSSCARGMDSSSFGIRRAEVVSASLLELCCRVGVGRPAHRRTMLLAPRP